jgi:hypothetical protein
LAVFFSHTRVLKRIRFIQLENSSSQPLGRNNILWVDKVFIMVIMLPYNGIQIVFYYVLWFVNHQMLMTTALSHLGPFEELDFLLAFVKQDSKEVEFLWTSVFKDAFNVFWSPRTF